MVNTYQTKKIVDLYQLAATNQRGIINFLTYL